MKDTTKQQALEALFGLDRWVQEHKLSGFDPYDLRGTCLYLWSTDPIRRRSLAAKLMRYGFSVMEDRFPGGMRKLFGVRPALNAKAMGLFARSYLNMHSSGQGEESLRKATECLGWLETNSTPGYSGPCWGYPFDWQSTVFIPKGTPSSVVSWTVGDAFWHAYKVTGERHYLDVCKSICEFFVNDLNQDRIAADQLCFSYTPLDRMHVFNATLFVGEFLIRVGKETGNSSYERDGRAVANYIVANQRPDGSWPYFGSEDKRPATVDHYHTGFVLRMLACISDITQEAAYDDACKKGFDFYWNVLFEPSGLPRYFTDRVYPVNIHSISEALLCLKLFDGRYRETSARIEWILDWALANMRDASGFFYYTKHRNRTVKIPFMRWGQAWMHLALSEVLAGAGSGRAGDDLT